MLNATIDLGDVPTRHFIDFSARMIRLRAHRQQLANDFHIKPKFSGMTDEVEPRGMAFIVSPLPAFRARWRRQEANLFIVTDGRNFDVRAPRQFTD